VTTLISDDDGDNVNQWWSWWHRQSVMIMVTTLISDDHGDTVNQWWSWWQR